MQARLQQHHRNVENGLISSLVEEPGEIQAEQQQQEPVFPPMDAARYARSRGHQVLERHLAQQAVIVSDPGGIRAFNAAQAAMRASKGPQMQEQTPGYQEQEQPLEQEGPAEEQVDQIQPKNALKDTLQQLDGLTPGEEDIEEATIENARMASPSPEKKQSRMSKKSYNPRKGRRQT